MFGRRPTPSIALALLAVSTVSLALVATPRIARAQSECDAGAPMPPDLSVVANFPSSSEVGAPIDPFVRVRYGNRAPPHPFIRVAPMAGGSALPGTVNVIANEVHWHGDSPLSPNTAYAVSFTDIENGGSNEFTFTTGSAHSVDWATASGGVGADGGSNAFTGLPETGADPSNPKVEKAGQTDTCGDPEARNVTYGWHNPPDTHYPIGDIEFVIYQTRGPGIRGPVERARVRGGATSTCDNGYEQCTTFRLAPENASAPVCFNIQAVDPYGRADGNTSENCFDPSLGPYFNGCSASPSTPAGESPGPRGWLAMVAVGALGLVTALGVRGRRSREG